MLNLLLNLPFNIGKIMFLHEYQKNVQERQECKEKPVTNKQPSEASVRTPSSDNNNNLFKKPSSDSSKSDNSPPKFYKYK